jgi:hypothetical protein
MKYGIRRLSTEWCCQGNKNYTGTKEELTKLVNSWKKNGNPIKRKIYSYTLQWRKRISTSIS